MSFGTQLPLRSRILGRQAHDPGPWVDLAWRQEQRRIQDAILSELTETKARRDIKGWEQALLRRKDQSERFGDHLWHHAGDDLIIAEPNLYNESSLKRGNTCLYTARLWGSAGQSDRCFAALLFGGHIMVDSLEHDQLNDHERTSATNILGIIAAAAEDMELTDRSDDVAWLSAAAVRYPHDPAFAVRPTPR